MCLYIQKVTDFEMIDDQWINILFNFVFVVWSLSWTFFFCNKKNRSHLIQVMKKSDQVMKTKINLIKWWKQKKRPIKWWLHCQKKRDSEACTLKPNWRLIENQESISHPFVLYLFDSLSESLTQRQQTSSVLEYY